MGRTKRMSYYAVVTAVERNTRTSFQVSYELRSDDTGEVADTGSMSLQFIPADATDPDTGQAYTPEQKRELYANQVCEHFRSVVARAQEADVEYDAVAQMLSGLRYPVAE